MADSDDTGVNSDSGERLHTDERLLRLLDGYIRLNGVPTKAEFDAADETPSVRAYEKRFGTWTDALDAIGYQPRGSGYNYTDEEILTALAEWVEQHDGQIPKRSDLRDADNLPTVATFSMRFGGVMNALEEAGIPQTRGTGRPPNSGVSADQLLSDLRNLIDQLGTVPPVEDFIASDLTPRYIYYRRVFGSYTAAVEELERIDQPDESDGAYAWQYPENEKLRAVKRFAEEQGEVPTKADFVSSDQTPKAHIYTKDFGSWDTVLEQADLNPEYINRGYTDQQLREILAQWVAQQPESETTQTYFRRDDRTPSIQPYTDRFGSWDAALEEADVSQTEANTNRATLDHNIPRQELISPLQQLAEEIGETPRLKDAKESEIVPNPRLYMHEFGSWVDAIEAANLPPRDRREYTTDEILRQFEGWVSRHDRIPTISEINDADSLPSYGVYYDRFETLQNVVSESELDVTDYPEFLTR